MKSSAQKERAQSRSPLAKSRIRSRAVSITFIVFGLLALGVFRHHCQNTAFMTKGGDESRNINTRASVFNFNTGSSPREKHRHRSHLELPVPQRANGLRAVVGDPLATLTLNVSEPLGGGEEDAWISVKWGGVQHPNPYDWIGVFPCLEDTCNEAGFGHAPTQYKMLSKDRRTKPGSSGTANFWIQARPGVCAYRLIYVSGNFQYPFQVARSPIVTFNPEVCDRPMHRRLSLGPERTSSSVDSESSVSMRVMWTQRSAQCSHVPQVKWERSPSVISHMMSPSASATRALQVSQDDMCDIFTTAAGSTGWIPSGVHLSAVMTGLLPGQTYSYVVGDELNGWSEPQHFTVPLVGRGSSRRSDSAERSNGKATKMVVFGDMGQSLNAKDESMQHSWDYHYHGEIHAPNNTMRTAALVNEEEASLVLHFGDISYAVGYESEWDTFMLQVEPVAAKVPWMTAIGNHEMGWSQGYYAENDSGGECGYQYIARFPFSTFGFQDYPSVPMCSSGQEEVESRHWVGEEWRNKPWYSFDHEGAHVTVMSSEHDFAPGSEQFKFLEKDLKSVDRTKTPWLVFTGHRPMYIHSDWEGDQNDANLLVNSLESLLVESKVDIALWGHHHSYQRSCHVHNSKCVSAENGILHVVVGSAGYDHSLVSKKYSSIFEYTNDKDWGVALLELGDDGKGKLEFRRDTDGKVLDLVEFDRKA